MIAPGNHLDFDSLRGAPPRGEALPIPEGAEPAWDISMALSRGRWNALKNGDTL